MKITQFFLRTKVNEAKAAWLSVWNKWDTSPEYRMRIHANWLNAEAELRNFKKFRVKK